MVVTLNDCIIGVSPSFSCIRISFFLRFFSFRRCSRSSSCGYTRDGESYVGVFCADVSAVVAELISSADADSGAL